MKNKVEIHNQAPEEIVKHRNFMLEEKTTGHPGVQHWSS